jgi:hypothetical protein
MIEGAGSLGKKEKCARSIKATLKAWTTRETPCSSEAGRTYYLRYHALFLKDSPGIDFFEPVDEDEGLLLVERTEASTSSLKK